MGRILTCSDQAIKSAARSLIEGNLVAFPTETVYGLGADATNKKAIARIYSAKGRPLNHPLIVHISSISQLSKWAIRIPQYATTLANAFWPGPMTLILTRSKLAMDEITGDQTSIGIRIPSNPQALALLQEFERIGGLGVAAPSANRFGAVSATEANEVEEELGDFLDKKDLILDGGKSQIGIESTIIDCTASAPLVLRPGAVSKSMINALLKLTYGPIENYSRTRASGMLTSHYSPKASVALNSFVNPGDGFIAMAEFKTPDGAIRLASPKTVSEFANSLYKALRLADQLGLRRVVAYTHEGNDLEEAINDRLQKASYRD
jgi:L-threonylcarbamoyladenylate synthase